MLVSGDLESSTSWNDAVILDSVLNSSESISDCLLGLSDRIIIWSLDKDGAREGILNSLDEGVLIITKNLLVHMLGESEILLSHVVDTVKLLSSTSERDSLSISLLGSSDSDDSVLGQKLEGGWVNSLLVNDNKILISSVTELSLELNNFHDLIISELSL